VIRSWTVISVLSYTERDGSNAGPAALLLVLAVATVVLRVASI
jgi:hypothetical protein